MNNNINNNVNFTAKLNIRALTQNKSRWNKIAQEFEQQTKKFEDDTLVLSNDNELEIAKHYGPKVTTEMSKLHDLFLTPEGTKKLLQLSDEKIAKKLALILNIFKKEHETDRAKNYLYQVTTPSKNRNTNIDENLVNQMLDALKNKIIKDTNDSFANDKVFQNGINKYWSVFTD